MNALHINFAPPGWRRALFQTRLWIWLLLLAGLALCIAGTWSAQRLLADIDTTRAAQLQVQSKLEERLAASTPVPKKIAVSDAQAAAVNTAIAQLNLPWRDVFDAIEAATPKTIALLALEPDAKRDVVKGTAEAKTSDDMIAYIEQLKKQGFFNTVLLAKHEINEQDPNKPLRFQFEAQWQGVVP